MTFKIYRISLRDAPPPKKISCNLGGSEANNKFWDTFYEPIFFAIFGKVSQKIQKSEAGGSHLFWTKAKLKLHFLGGSVPYLVNIVYFITESTLS